ncbi:hypothetical protein WUBG_04240 [Wuchereria bancrofti]|nr:hypothetical protein WUBG_04240 [Wuchereria bancrofti]
MEDAFSLLRPVRAYPNSTDKRSKDFAKKLSKYFRPYWYGSSVVRFKLSISTDSTTSEVITLADSQKTLKRNATCEFGTDNEVIKVGNLSTFDHDKVFSTGCFDCLN